VGHNTSLHCAMLVSSRISIFASALRPSSSAIQRDNAAFCPPYRHPFLGTLPLTQSHRIRFYRPRGCGPRSPVWEMVLQRLHPHPRDALIEFDAPTHTYRYRTRDGRTPRPPLPPMGVILEAPPPPNRRAKGEGDGRRSVEAIALGTG